MFTNIFPSVQTVSFVGVDVYRFTCIKHVHHLPFLKIATSLEKLMTQNVENPTIIMVALFRKSINVYEEFPSKKQLKES